MPKRLSLPKRLSQFAREDTGSVLVMTALLSPLVMGGLGLGVETGHWYQKQRQLQHIADLTSHAAASRLRAGDDGSSMYVDALSIAKGSGFSYDIGEITMYSPPRSGPNAGNADAVEVILSETRPRWFTAFFMDGDVELTARSVSLIEGGSPACILALSETASGAVTVTGSTDVGLTNCVVSSNSAAQDAFSMESGASYMTTDCVHTVGGATYTANLTLNDCTEPKTLQPKTRDPYADRTEPTVWGTCSNGRVGHPQSSTTVSATDNHPNGMSSKRFCNGLSLQGDVTFEPGLYIIDGGTFSINAQANITGLDGVTFFLTNGAEVQYNGGATVNLAAPTSGPTSGMLFWESRDSTSSYSGCGHSGGSISHKFNGGSSMSLQGALYMPVSDVTFNGGSDAQNGCTQIVGNTVRLSGSSNLAVSCENKGTDEILSSEVVAVVE
ncbi:pilus assembly protein TadG-related protein [Thalassovita mangrovi]|uniref:pilus assembly protein TadG-related protein n=1 Tax=Thalassovita mangrovi TaxID=2692236 RepID=UPI0022A6E041|nr:pilus assembly protein TadG-related protein [Thalassovita mangrovi]